MLTRAYSILVSLVSASDQVALCSSPGTWLYLRNSHVTMFQSHIRLLVDRWGKIEVAADDAKRDQRIANEPEKNISAQEYQLVDVPA